MHATEATRKNTTYLLQMQVRSGEKGSDSWFAEIIHGSLFMIIPTQEFPSHGGSKYVIALIIGIDPKDVPKPYTLNPNSLGPKP